ncbi:MAG: hypothetical protein ACI835_003374 [Planctomycetota bacterium]|jgi:hypothetical protein
MCGDSAPSNTARWGRESPDRIWQKKWGSLPSLVARAFRQIRRDSSFCPICRNKVRHNVIPAYEPTALKTRSRALAMTSPGPATTMGEYDGVAVPYFGVAECVRESPSLSSP